MSVGTIEQRSPGSWRIRLELSRDPQSGRRRFYTRTVRGSRREAEAELARMITVAAPLQRRGPRSLHGTRARFAYGCRCEPCHVAALDYQRRLRSTQRTSAPHGTRRRYSVGCRCEPCAEGERAYKRTWRAGQPERPRRRRPLSQAHGTRHQYNRGCRCERCRAAERVARREWRARRDGVAELEVHGTRAAAATCGCARCGDVRLLAVRRRWTGKATGIPVPFPVRFPLEPLLVHAGCGSLLESAKALGVHPRQLYRWRDNGLTVDQADELAVKVGAHPSEVWPDWSTVAG